MPGVSAVCHCVPSLCPKHPKVPQGRLLLIVFRIETWGRGSEGGEPQPTSQAVEAGTMEQAVALILQNSHVMGTGRIKVLFYDDWVQF